MIFHNNNINKTLKMVVLGSSLIASPFLFGSKTFAQEINPTDIKNIKNMPLEFSAEELTFDKVYGTITARGNVEVNQENAMLKADTVNYNVKTKEVSASGNVVIVHADGSVIFADYSKLSGNLKTGIIKNLKLILADKSRMAAKKAEKTYDNKNILEKVVYSPCSLCETNPDKPPVWQIKALKVIHDEKKQDVEYEGAWLEMFGTPVFYTPYISHPGPEVKRRSGMLMPKFGNNNALGTMLQTPYYYAPDENKDFVFAPMVTTKENVVLLNEFRSMFNNGETKGKTSLTYDSDEQIRAHIDADFRYEINDYWRAKVKANRSSYDTYGKKYDIDEDSDTWLESNIKVEGFDNRSYSSLEGYSFQDLRENYDDDNTPFVVPNFLYHHVDTPSKYGSYKDFKISTAGIYREKGVKSNRLSLEQGWHLPYTSPLGEIYNLDASVRADGYYIQNKPRVRAGEFTGTVGRVYPEVSLGWKLPLVRGEQASSQVVEPMVVAAYSPKGSNSEKISNEDSRDMVFDDSNVMETNRFTGYDRVETGPRINYGLKWSAYGEKSGQASFFLGQSYRFIKNNDFAEESGLERNFSDVVGRIYASPHRYLDMLYRYSLNSKNLEARRSELSMTVGLPLAKLYLEYMFINGTTGELSDFDDREEITATLKSNITRYWSTELSHKHNLTDNGGAINYSGHIVYEDECFKFDSSIEKDFSENEDYEGGFSVYLTLTFKSLGSVQTGGASF